MSGQISDPECRTATGRAMTDSGDNDTSVQSQQERFSITAARNEGGSGRHPERLDAYGAGQLPVV